MNITIADVEAELELIIRLGNCKFLTLPPKNRPLILTNMPPVVDIVNRTLSSLDLNPTLITLLNSVTDVVTEVIGAVDGLLGSIVSGDSTLNFLIDNLGNIVQETVGGASSIIGNFLNNMTLVGDIESLGGGLIQKTYSYEPLGALVDIVTNALGQVVQATVVSSSSTAGAGAGAGSTTGTATTAPASTTATTTGAAKRLR